jgi:Ca2+-binding RTX toxin-like protein
MVDPKTDQFYLGWKPSEPRFNDDVHGRFLLDDADRLGQYSSKQDASGAEVAATIDYYTDEGLLLALLAMGSPDLAHRLGREVWDSMIRKTQGGTFVRSYPGSLFTYQFLSAWVDTGSLGSDNHPTQPVDWFDNTRQAILATIDYASDNPRHRATLDATHWGLSACEGPFDDYFADATPAAAIAETGPPIYQPMSVEGESGAGQTESPSRSNAFGGKTARFTTNGQIGTISVDLALTTDYQVKVRYSNDGSADSIHLALDGVPLGNPFVTQDTRPSGGTPGSGWNEFAWIGPLGTFALTAGHHVLTVTVDNTDPYGVEVDLVSLEPHRSLEVGTVTNYATASSILHVPDAATAALWQSAAVDRLLHPRFGFADAFNRDVHDAYVAGGVQSRNLDLFRNSGSWANFTGFAIDHGPMLVIIDNYLTDQFVPRLFMSHAGIDAALKSLFTGPTVTIASPTDGYHGVRGQERTFAFTAIQPGGPGRPFTYKINWGDGSPVQAVQGSNTSDTLQVAHAFASDGSYTITATATDQNGVTGPISPASTVSLVVVEQQGPSVLLGGSTGNDRFVVALGTAPRALSVRVNNTLYGSFVVDSAQILGQTGADTLTIKGTTGPDAFAIGAEDVVVNGLAVQFADVEQLTLDGGSGNDTYRVSDLSTTTTLVDSKGTDLLDFSQATAGVTIDLSKSSGQTQKVFAPGNTNTLALKGTFENVIGTPKADLIKGNSSANQLRGGDDSDSLYGEAGNDVLLGASGDDLVDGGSGRDLLIGGEGVDTLQGGSGEDLLIGGTTSYDNNDDALAAIMAEWTFTKRKFEDRCDQLADEIGGIQLKKDTTVLDDHAIDTLYGGSGSDWFFQFPLDALGDFNSRQDRVN